MLSLWPYFFRFSMVQLYVPQQDVLKSSSLQHVTYLAHYIIRMAVFRHNFYSFWIFFQILKIQSLDISLQYHRTLTSNR